MTTTTTEIDLNDVRERVTTIERAMNGYFVERRDTVRALWLSMLSRLHGFLVGPPGTGKSAMADAVMESVTGARKFSMLFTKFTTPDEVYGAFSYAEMKEGRLTRVTDGRMADCELAFADECFRGNGAVLDANLKAWNEGVFEGKKIPLRTLFAAANTLPEDEGLAAIFDRLVIRDYVGRISLQGRSELRRRATTSQAPFTPPATITLDELDAAVGAVRALPFSENALAALDKVDEELAKLGIDASERRQVRIMPAIQACAWLDGEPEVLVEHVAQALRYCLWNTLEEREQVAGLLRTFDAGPVTQAIRLIDETLEVWAQRPTSPALLRERLPEMHKRVGDTAAKVKAIMKDAAVSARGKARVNAALSDLRTLDQDIRAMFAADVKDLFTAGVQ